MNQHSEIVYSKQVLEFITVANDFCLFVEKADTYDKKFVLEYLNKVMPLMYIKGTLLPDINPADSEANEKFVTEEMWTDVYGMFKTKLNKDDVAFIIEDTRGDNSQIVKVSLAELIADIYQDMKDFLLLYQKNTKAAKENAVNGIKEYFFSHWGQRCLSVLKISFDVLYPQKYDLFQNE